MAEDNKTGQVDETKEMTKKQAVAILKSYNQYSKEELLEAITFLENGLNNTVILDEFRKEYYKTLTPQEMSAEEYLQARQILGDSEYVERLKSEIDPVEENSSDETENTAEEGSVRINPEQLNQNAVEIDSILSKNIPAAEFWQQPEFAKLADLVRIPVLDEDGFRVKDNGTEAYYADEKKQEFLNSVYDAAAAKVLQDNLNNQIFADYDADKKAEYIRQQINTQVSTDILTMYIASGVNKNLHEKLAEIIPDLPSKPEGDDIDKCNQYNRQLAAKVTEAMRTPEIMQQIVSRFNENIDRLADYEGTINISPYQFLTNQSDKQVEIGIQARKLFKAYKQSEGKVDARKAAMIMRRYENKLSEAGKKIHGKIYKIAVGIKEFAHNQPGKTIELLGQLGIAGGNMTMAGLGWFGKGASAGGLASVLAGAMVAHTFAKGAVYPVVTEWKKMANDTDFRKLGWFQKYKAARKAAKEKDPNLNWHLATGGVALIAWAAGQAALGPLGGKIAASATIALGNAISKQREFNRAKKLYELTGDEKYRKELYGDKDKPAKGLFGKLQKLMGSKRAQKNLAWMGAVAGALGVASQINKAVAASQDVAETIVSSHTNGGSVDAVSGAGHSADPLGPVKGDPADWKDHMQMSTPLREGWGELPAENTVGGVPGAAGTEAVMPSVEDSFFPEQYDAAMGISSAQYNNLLKLYSTEDLDRMYMNLNDSGVMEHMNGMTKEQFIFKWSKLDAYTDRVRWDEKAQQYISIQGAKRYHFEEEMTDLNKMLNCGDKLELAQVEKIKAALGTIDDRGGYHGPGYVPTENYHVKGAGVDGPCSEGQENHFNRGGKVTKTIQYREAVSEEAAPKSAPVSVDLNMEYGESQYNIPHYQQQMTDGVGTFEKQVEGKTHWMVSGPHGQHPIPEDAKMTMNAKTGEVLVEYSEKDGRAPEIYHKSALRKEIDTVKQTYEEPVKVAVPYTSLSEQTVNEAAELAGCKPGELTKTSVFNGTSQFRMYTEDGVVRVSVDKANVPHFSMENMDGTEATAVPTKIVEGRFKEADALLREGKYTSIPAKNEVSSQLIKSRIIARGGQGK